MNKIKIFSMFFLLVEVFYPVQSSYNVQMVFYPPDGLSNPVYLQNAPSGVLADGSVYGTGYNLGSIASAYNQNSQLVGTQYQGPCNVLLIKMYQGYPPNDLYYETYDSSPLVATSVANAFSGWSQNPAGYTQTWIQVVVGYGTSTAIYIVDKMYNEVLLPDEIVVIDPQGAINMNVKRKVSLSGTPLNALRFFYLMVTAGYKYKGVSCANEPDALNNGGSCYYSTPCIAYPFDYSNIQGYIYNSGSSC